MDSIMDVMRALLCLLAAILLPALPGVPAGAGAHPRVTIVFEHAGSSLTDLAPIYAMHLPFGLGIFPKMRYSARIAREAAQHGLTPMLHLPMEARHPPDMGAVPGAVWVRMADAEIQAVVEEDLASVPGVAGVSNHAGSRATADRRVMLAVLRTVKARGLWFEENRTTEASVASNVAARLGIPLVLVTRYLDDPPVNIERKTRALIEAAKRDGAAIAVAHITTGAPQIVGRLLPEFRRAGIVFVPVTEFLKDRARP
jgi:uncharacterized protein